MKRLKVIMSFVFFLLLVGQSATGENLLRDDFLVEIDGRQLVFNEEVGYPLLLKESHRTLIPLRIIAEELGYRVEWNQELQEAYIEGQGKELLIAIGMDRALLDGVEVPIDSQGGTQAMLIPVKGSYRTYVPLRFVSEVMGSKVDYKWLDNKHHINIFTGFERDGYENTLEEGKIEKPIEINKNKTIALNGVERRINLVSIDLNDPQVNFEVVTANDKISGDESFSDMINRKKPLAAINGNFFDAYSSLEPYGTIMKKGNIEYLEGKNTSLVIKEDNIDIGFFATSIQGYLDGKRSNSWNNESQTMDFYLFNIWYVNNLPKDSSGVYMYTRERGSSIVLNGGTVVEVVENKVKNVYKSFSEVIIPQNGYLIYYGVDAASDSYIESRFKIGRSVELEYIVDIENGLNQDFNLNEAREIISAGPFLVKDNKIILDSINEGFVEDKILTGRAQRSAIGVSKDNRLIMVTAAHLTMGELAEIMVSLNCKVAMNLDGGASSALYADGSLITSPGRRLNNVLMIYR